MPWCFCSSRSSWCWGWPGRLSDTPHTPCTVLYFVTMLIGCGLGLAIRWYDRFVSSGLRLSVGTLLSNGPESTVLDDKKLSFMQSAWGAVGGSALRDAVERQVHAGEPRPQVALGVRQLRHHFGPSLRDLWALYHPTHAVCCALLGYHAYWMRIGACDPMP